MFDRRPFTILLVGCTPSNANCGVSALCLATLANLKAVFPDARLIVMNSGLATRVAIRTADNMFEVETSWIVPSRFLRPRSGTRFLDILRRLQGWIPAPLHRYIRNRAFEHLLDADVVLDISGGDSFSEIYGQAQFEGQVAIKRLVLAMRKPLVLLPQTFGPFTSTAGTDAARQILRRSLLVASRDRGGIGQLRQLMGDNVTPQLVECPDIAFSMDPVPVEHRRLPALLQTSSEGPLLGLNVSGLLTSSKSDLTASRNYNELISAVIEWTMSIPQARLLLVPHVFGRGCSSNGRRNGFADMSDLDACKAVYDANRDNYGQRIDCVREPMSAPELKFLIGHCDFFIGARMHSCIAAVSQCIPTAVMAYSPKAQGVFGMLGADKMVVDIRGATVRDAAESIAALYRERNWLRRALDTRIADVKEAVHNFFNSSLPAALAGSGISRESQRSP